jgi:fibrillarin-like rRNA methylase
LNTKGQAGGHTPNVLPETPIRGKHIDWINREKELGFDFGPTFHHISDIYTNGKTHTVRGNMKISRSCGIMEAESRYILHPTVIDACLQPFLALLHK